jgi:hypothetical protein
MILNSDESDYEADDPATWYTTSDLAHDFRKAGRYDRAASLYYTMAFELYDMDVYSWLHSALPHRVMQRYGHEHARHQEQLVRHIAKLLQT